MMGSQLSTYVDDCFLDLARRQGCRERRKRSVALAAWLGRSCNQWHFEHLANTASGLKANSRFMSTAQELATALKRFS